jgi:hypothetical protein
VFHEGLMPAAVLRVVANIRREFAARLIMRVEVYLDGMRVKNGLLFSHRGVVPIYARPLYNPAFDSVLDPFRAAGVVQDVYDSDDAWVYADEVANMEMIDIARIQIGRMPTNGQRVAINMASYQLSALLEILYGARRGCVETGTNPNLSPNMEALVPNLSATKDGIISHKVRYGGRRRNVSIAPQSHNLFLVTDEAIGLLDKLPLQRAQLETAKPFAARTAWRNVVDGNNGPMTLLRKGAGDGWSRTLPNGKRALDAIGFPSNHIRVDEWPSTWGESHPNEFDATVTFPDGTYNQIRRTNAEKAYTYPGNWENDPNRRRLNVRDVGNRRLS